jgi:hypothetical protein
VRPRLYTAAIFAGVAAVLVLAVVVFVAGRFDPSPPSLRDHPVAGIPGEILYVDGDGCIVRAQASGERRERVTCVGEALSLVSWVDADTIGYAVARPGPSWIELDLATGEERTSDAFARPEPPGPVSPLGERIDIADDGSVYRLSGGERTKIFDFDGPKHQRPWLVTWSPDGEWVLLRYKDELWIVSRDGTIQGTLATTRPWPQEASWWIDGHGYRPAVTIQSGDASPPQPVAVPVR